MATAPPTNLIWSLAAAKTTTTIATSGNSGGFAAGKSAVDLRGWSDFGLFFAAAGGSGTSATVQLDGFDGQGNTYTQLLKVTLASSGSQVAGYGGIHGGTAYFVAPDWGRVSWTLTGTMTGCEIFLYGR